MSMPSAIQAYFDADRGNDGAALIRAFAPDAVVDDEGQSHAGHHAIEAWWRKVKAKYQHVTVPLDVVEKDDVTRVRARVSGRFPGSPVTLTFAFRLHREQITGLEIGA
jgi:ketosteroid isomerase-like protein